jgi:REP element-mobilizing transposase RayT
MKDGSADAAVAAVYDRRKQIPAVTDSRYNTNKSVVAEVYERRIENETGAHRDAATKQSLQKPRLRRLDRVFGEPPIYFVSACTVDRKALLACAEVHDAFRTFCLNSPQHGAWVGRYVLMPDHLHLFVCLEGIPLSNWVKSLKNSLSKSLRTTGHDGPHWQKGFFDHLLRSGESYSQKWDYVRENPVRGGLVSATEDWPYAAEIHDLEYRK